jgi:hypothetical protein
MTHNDKIGKMPKAVCKELNFRPETGKKSRTPGAGDSADGGSNPIKPNETARKNQNPVPEFTLLAAFLRYPTASEFF